MYTYTAAIHASTAAKPSKQRIVEYLLRTTSNSHLRWHTGMPPKVTVSRIRLMGGNVLLRARRTQSHM